METNGYVKGKAMEENNYIIRYLEYHFMEFYSDQPARILCTLEYIQAAV